MAQTNSSVLDSTSSRAERPWLLPTNRKLRNLVSISLRNLSWTSTSPSRRLSKTFDDDALPQTLKSPAKLVALREHNTLGHSRSSSDLRAVAEDDHDDVNGETVGATTDGSPRHHRKKQDAAPIAPRRPEFKPLRRRSTLEWANATPQKRQEKLEAAIKGRMADVFFTLHVPGIEEPVYVSEVVEKTINPTFRHVDWSTCGPGVTRLEQATLCAWVRGGHVEQWRQLLHLNVDMRGLQYLGKTLESLDCLLPSNAVLFHFNDGIYTTFSGSLTDYVPHLHARPRPSATGPGQHRTLPTSSFDALLRLSKLDDSIQDALATRDEIARDLEQLLRNNKEALNERDEVAEADDRLKTIDFAKKVVEKQLEKARKQQAEKRSSITARRELMASDLNNRDTELQEMRDARPELPNIRSEHEVKSKAIQNQRRRICEDLQQSYPIQPLPGKTLAFTIRDLYLPNSEHLEAKSPEIVAAALGHIAHVLQLLTFYLDQTLPYPVELRGSTSTIHDPISILQTNSTAKTARTYPLFSKGVPRFRFEYAVFLLNQDIRILLEDVYNLRVLDIRQTLPNLKYLLYVATAGEGELPGRKAGGVRGLVRANESIRRVASRDSASSGMSGATAVENGRAKGGAVDRLREVSGMGGKGKDKGL